MKNNKIKTFEDAKNYILSIPKFSKKNSIKDTIAFYHLLKKPSINKKIIHVAGTNGKGSVCAYINGMLQELNVTTGMFTSPHLIDICERIQINGNKVTQDLFMEAFYKVESHISGSYHPSFFEYLFFMAMILFEQSGVEYIILETGLGGRLDATNIIEQPLLCVITKIDMDHMEYLGNSLDQIAMEKAGIIKKNVPVVSIYQTQKVYSVLVEQAQKKNSAITFVEKCHISFLSFHHKSIDFSIKSRYYKCIRLRAETCACYQMENIALAINVIESLFLKNQITKEHIQQGIQKVKWDGRMEEVLPNVFVDGAHNVNGMKAFVQSVSQFQDHYRNHLLFSVVNDKQYEQMVHILTKDSLFYQITVTTIGDNRKLPLCKLESVFKNNSISSLIFEEDTGCALKQSLKLLGEKDRLFIVGSLYLVGFVKEFILIQE